ncbi:MAG: RNA-binding S4 domain-containing protein [Clostridia bacterium]|nr:RNA-binding S4 domain-containing protein [Clostridia bacterium]
MNKLLINDEYIRLCDAMKLSGEAETGGMAKMMILSGDVAVNGEVCLQKGKKLYEGDRFTFDGSEYLIVR